MKLAQTVFLKQSFFERHKDHKEILTNKAGRPYLSFIIECNGTLFAIPFRTNIKHPYAFIFKTSGRHSDEKKGLPGIDFTKAVVIQQIDIECQCTIDKKEWVELNKNQLSILYNKKRASPKPGSALGEREDFLTVNGQHERTRFIAQDVNALAKASIFHRFLHVRHIVFDNFDKPEAFAREVIDTKLAV